MNLKEETSLASLVRLRTEALKPKLEAIMDVRQKASRIALATVWSELLAESVKRNREAFERINKGNFIHVAFKRWFFRDYANQIPSADEINAVMNTSLSWSALRGALRGPFFLYNKWHVFAPQSVKDSVLAMTQGSHWFDRAAEFKTVVDSLDDDVEIFVNSELLYFIEMKFAEITS